jgi:hypothetical protein
LKNYGIEIDDNVLHSQKQLLSRDFTYSGIVIDVNDGHPEKQ